jgi:hypothetical protein
MRLQYSSEIVKLQDVFKYKTFGEIDSCRQKEKKKLHYFWGLVLWQ